MELMTVTEVAKKFRVTPRAVRYWITAGRLRAVRLGKHWRIEAADVERAIEETQHRDAA